MIARIDHIDAIARRNGGDALFLDFAVSPHSNSNRPSRRSKSSYNKGSPREEIIEWLIMNGIGWQPCGDFACVDRYVEYRDQIYIDVICDPQNAIYQRVIEYLETPSGVSRFEGVSCKICTLELALSNISHDQPGFWEKWADNF